MTYDQDVFRVTTETPLQKHARYVSELATARRQRDNARHARSKARGTGTPDPVLERAAFLAEVEVEMCIASVLVSWADFQDTMLAVPA